MLELAAAYPHLRGELIDKIYGKLTLQQTVAFDDWLISLPDEIFGAKAISCKVELICAWSWATDWARRSSSLA